MEEPEAHERRITVDGMTVLVNVYGDGAGYWLLEVVDEHWNSTCWDDPFEVNLDTNSTRRTLEPSALHYSCHQPNAKELVFNVPSNLRPE